MNGLQTYAQCPENLRCPRCRRYGWSSAQWPAVDARGVWHHPACPDVQIAQAQAQSARASAQARRLMGLDEPSTGGSGAVGIDIMGSTDTLQAALTRVDGEVSTFDQTVLTRKQVDLRSDYWDFVLKYQKWSAGWHTFHDETQAQINDIIGTSYSRDYDNTLSYEMQLVVWQKAYQKLVDAYATDPSPKISLTFPDSPLVLNDIADQARASQVAPGAPGAPAAPAGMSWAPVALIGLAVAYALLHKKVPS